MNPPLDVPGWAWLLFAVIIVVSLAVDLWAHRGGRSLSRRQAIGWSVAWVVLALLFGAGVAAKFGWDTALEFIAAYATEKSLSLDNLFLFIVIFARLGIPEGEQHRVLFWGILGAFATRAAFIAAGTALLAAWHPVVYVLGAFLLFTGIKTALERPEAEREGRLLAFLRRHLPLTARLSGHRFFVVEGGRLVGTPLLLALIAIEFTDVVFAVDSVPAALAISKAPFIVYSSNVFAVLGLRALYLVIAHALSGLKYLRFGLGAILAFAGCKMLLGDVFPISHVVALLVIVLSMTLAIAASLFARRGSREGASTPDGAGG
ncbi:MAG TPA: TerC/Alx family metal homeostasis membrane protein [Polyangiaceae bacterium]